MMKRLSPIYFFENLCGAALVFYFTQSIAALAKAEHRDYYDASDSFTFLADTWLIFLTCFIVNLVWACKAVFDIFKRRNFRPCVWLGAVTATWIVSFLAIRLIP